MPRKPAPRRDFGYMRRLPSGRFQASFGAGRRRLNGFRSEADQSSSGIDNLLGSRWGGRLAHRGGVLLCRSAHILSRLRSRSACLASQRSSWPGRGCISKARELQRDVAMLPTPTPFGRLDRLNCVGHLRHFWTTWAPVPRSQPFLSRRRGAS